MDKSLSQSTISKSKPVSSSSESEDDCDKKCKNPRNIQNPCISRKLEMVYLACPIPNRSKPQCLICYEIISENKKSSVKRHYLSKHSTSIEKKISITDFDLIIIKQKYL